MHKLFAFCNTTPPVCVKTLIFIQFYELSQIVEYKVSGIGADTFN